MASAKLLTAKCAALAKILSGVEGESVKASEIDQDAYGFVYGSQEWQVLTDKEADKAAAENIEESVWAFNPSFLAAHSEAEESVFKTLQDTGKCESLNSAFKSLIKDWDHFVQDAIKADGRGHFLASYDFEEHEAKIDGQWFFAYRVN